MIDSHLYYLQEAFRYAEHSLTLNEVPIGAVLVHENKIIASGYNTKECKSDVTGHAEIMCLRQASEKLNSWRLLDTTLYTTLEPCLMCGAALIHARIQSVVWGANDPKGGAESVYNIFSKPKLNHRVGFTYVEHMPSATILKGFFKQRRKN